MKRNKGWFKAECSKISWAVMVILLCAAPCVWADETVPAGETKDIDYTISGNLMAYGTVKLLPPNPGVTTGAIIQGLVYTANTSVLNIEWGTVLGWIDVNPSAIVTVYGTGFDLGEGTHFIDFGTVTGYYENGDLFNLTFDCQVGATVTLAAPGSEPPENNPPEADAGPDISVSTMDIASTVIQGTATDADVLDSLQYRWLEGTVKFTQFAPVGANGEAPLDLGIILPQYLGVGTHTLKLEVTDGKETVWDEMVLEILPIHVDIDIKPGSTPNAINLGSNGVIPVAILTTTDFDAATVNPDTVLLAGSGVAVRGKADRLMARLEDVDGDGDDDLLLQVETENLDPDTFQNGSAILTGQTIDGTNFEGSDSITIVPPE